MGAIKSNKILTCVVCGEDFVGSRRATCSEKCRYYYKKHMIKKEPTRECLMCGEKYILTRTDKLFCSNKCNTVYHQRTAKKPTELKECKNCKVEKKITDFYKKGQTYFPFCKECYDERYTDKYEREKGKVQHYKEIEAFLMKIKKQKYNADMIDIFNLINYHDLIFPTKIYWHMNTEDTSQRLFEDLAFWYKKKKEKIYKDI